MTTQKINAKALLSKMPDEVFQNFISPLIDDIGWPFTHENSSLHGTKWQGILSPLTLCQLCNMAWERKTILLGEICLYEYSKKDIDLIIRRKTEELSVMGYYDSKECRQSLLYHENIANSGQKFSTPITLALLENKTYLILDGNHRIASIFTTNTKDSFLLEAWIGY